MLEGLEGGSAGLWRCRWASLREGGFPWLSGEPILGTKGLENAGGRAHVAFRGQARGSPAPKALPGAERLEEGRAGRGSWGALNVRGLLLSADQGVLGADPSFMVHEKMRVCGLLSAPAGWPLAERGLNCRQLGGQRAGVRRALSAACEGGPLSWGETEPETLVPQVAGHTKASWCW